MVNRIVLNTVSYHGSGAVKEIGPELSARGFKKALVCSGKHVVKSGEINKILDPMKAAGIDYALFTDIKANPTIENVQNGVQAFKDAGADCIDLPAPGSRNGISVHMIQELVQYVHRYKPGTLAMTFLNSSVEGADPDTVRLIALKMKETGADVHAIGDGGFAGCTSPENIHQLSVSIKGRPYTYFRMASTNI